jgi:hypothetical protein
MVAGERCTVWMIVGSTGGGSLIVNRRVKVFGTQYDPRSDLARIPLRRAAKSASVERLTLSMSNGLLEIPLGDAASTVPLASVPEH